MQHPRHQGRLHDADGVGSIGNPACGDVVTIYLRIVDGTIQDARFESTGSAYQLATASILCDCVVGEAVENAKVRVPPCVLDRLPELPANKRHLAHLAIDALRRAIDDHERRSAGDEDLGPRRLTEAEARNFVLDLLANGREWGTTEIKAMATADRVALPDSPARFLSGLRASGVIAGRMDLDSRSWRWWALDSQRPGQSHEE